MSWGAKLTTYTHLISHLTFSQRIYFFWYLRPELPFEGIEKLIEAIKHDIVQAEVNCDVVDGELGILVQSEKAWVESDGNDL